MGGNMESKEEAYSYGKVLENVQQDQSKEIDFSGGNQTVIITGAFDGEIYFYDYHTGKLLRRFVNLRSNVTESDRVRYLLDYSWAAQNILQIESVGDDTIIVSTRDGVLREYGFNFEDGNLFLKREYIGHFIANGATESSVYGFEVDEKRRIVVSGGGDKTVRVWNLSSTSQKAQNLKTFTGSSRDEIGGVKILGGQNNCVISSDLSGYIFKHDLGKPNCRFSMSTNRENPVHTDFVFNMDFSERMNVLFTSSGDKTSKFFDMRTNKEIECLSKGHEQGFQSVIYLEDKNELILGEGTMRGLPSRRGSMLVYDLRKTKPSFIHKWKAHECDIHRIYRIRESFGDSSTRLLTCSRDYSVGLWSRNGGETEFKLVRRIKRKDQDPDWMNIIPGICFLNRFSRFWKFDNRYCSEFSDLVERCRFLRESNSKCISVVVSKQIIIRIHLCLKC